MRIIDLKVGESFTKGTDGIYTKIEHVNATGDGWCYCRNESDGKYYRMQWNVDVLQVKQD